MKIKRFTSVLTSDDMLDVMLLIEKKVILKFALNYRARINGRWRVVYRVDNYHGFLHEQKFWRSNEPIHLLEEEGFLLSIVVKNHIHKISKDFLKYRTYFERAKK